MPELLKTDADPTLPYLEHYPDPGGSAHRIPLDRLPFHIGRNPAAQYVLSSRQISKEHTVLFRVGDTFHIRDLGSTNGTYVNGQRVVEAPLASGDIVHVAHFEFRFVQQPVGAAGEAPITESALCQVPASLIDGGKHLRELIAQHRVSVLFQPIVRLAGADGKASLGAPLGYEALGRGNHEKLSPSPAELFRLAEHCRQAPELSRLFRMLSLQEASHLPPGALLFLNLHPTEMAEPRLLDFLAEAAQEFGDGRRLVLEAHEEAVADTSAMRRLRDQLRDLDIGLAYDDFGAGRSRLAHLAEVPPDFVKLDMKLVRGIDQAKGRQELLLALNRVGSDLGVQLIAEGIETREEAETCRHLGCLLGQGFLFARPQVVSLLTVKKASDTRRVDLSQLRQHLKSEVKGQRSEVRNQPTSSDL